MKTIHLQVLMFVLGLSVALNLCLIAFLVFVFKSPKYEDMIYDKFDNKKETIEKSLDPFAKL